MRRVHSWSSIALAAGSAVLLASSAFAARQVTITDVTPPNALAVAGIDDVPAMKAAFDRTGFKSLWDDPAIQKWIDEAMKSYTPQFEQTLDALDLKREDLKLPTGSAGFSAWAVGAGRDAKLAVLVLADYGDEAESMHETIVKALENAQKQGKIELKESEEDGLEFWTYSVVEPEDGDDDDGEDDDMPDFGGGADDLLGEAMLGDDALEEMHYARIGSHLVVTSLVETLLDTQAQIEGEDRPSVSDNAEFNAARRQVKNAPAFGVLLIQNGREQLKKEIEAQGEDAAEMAQALQMIDALGLGSVQAIGVGARLDTDSGMAEQMYGVLTPAKEGLLKLIDSAPMKFDPPAFVGGDAASTWSMQFDFSGVIPLLNKVIATMPEEQQGEVGGMVMMASATAGPLLANIGPEFSVTTAYDRPFAHDSQRMLGAFKTKDVAAIQQAIAGFAPMVGLESRDFLGNQIWSPAQGGFLPDDAVAIGIAAGYMFVGPGPTVENAVRTAAAGDAPKLASEPDFRRAMRPLAGQGLGFSFTSFARTMAYTCWMAQNIDKVLEAQHAAMFGGQPALDQDEQAWRDEMLKSMKESTPGWMKSMPPAEVFTRHIGDTSAEFLSTEDGFVARVVTLRPE